MDSPAGNPLNALVVVTGLFGAAFLALGIFRIRAAFGSHVFVTAEVISIREETDIDLMQIGDRRYLYPAMSFRYTYQGRQYIGEVNHQNAKRFRVPEIDTFGRKVPASRFAWRGLGAGSKIKITVPVANPAEAEPVLPRAGEYSSETLAYLFLGVLFLAAAAYVFNS